MRRILVSAYACEPGRGSEGEIGWSLVHELAKQNQVWVLTRANNCDVHEDAFKGTGKPPTLHFVYYDTPRWARWYKKGKRFFLVYYYVWQIGSAFAARRVVKEQGIELVHHLTGGMDWMPSGLAFAGRPFVWGPVGSERTNPCILRTLGLSDRAREWLRSLVQFYGRTLDPLVRLTARNARIILSHTPWDLPVRYAPKVVPYVQTGIRPALELARMKPLLGRGSPLTVVYAGELIHWKGAEYAVEAFLECARLRTDLRMIVVGDGPLRSSLEKRVARSGVALRVEFKGRVPMEQLVQVLALGDLFLYPSYHHGLATVVLQAMLTGMPVVCLEGDAIGRTVTFECGISVPPGSRPETISRLAEAVCALVDDEPRRLELAGRARQMALSRYSYELVGAGYEEIYRRVLAAS